MIKKFKIKEINISLVAKYKFNKEERKPENKVQWRKWNLGLWFKRSKIVSNKDVKNIKNWNKNLVYNYMLGVDLLIFKIWLSINKNGLELKEND